MFLDQVDEEFVSRKSYCQESFAERSWASIIAPEVSDFSLEVFSKKVMLFAMNVTRRTAGDGVRLIISRDSPFWDVDWRNPNPLLSKLTGIKRL